VSLKFEYFTWSACSECRLPITVICTYRCSVLHLCRVRGSQHRETFPNWPVSNQTVQLINTLQFKARYKQIWLSPLNASNPHKLSLWWRSADRNVASPFLQSCQRWRTGKLISSCLCVHWMLLIIKCWLISCKSFNSVCTNCWQILGIIWTCKLLSTITYTVVTALFVRTVCSAHKILHQTCYGESFSNFPLVNHQDEYMAET